MSAKKRVATLTFLAFLFASHSSWALSTAYLLFHEISEMQFLFQKTNPHKEISTTSNEVNYREFQNPISFASLGYDLRQSKISHRDEQTLLTIFHPLIVFDGLIDSYKYGFFTEHRIDQELAAKVCEKLSISSPSGEKIHFNLDETSIQWQPRSEESRVLSYVKTESDVESSNQNQIPIVLNEDENFWVESFTCVNTP